MERTPVLLAGTPFPLDGNSARIDQLIEKMEQVFGVGSYSDPALARILEILVAQTFASFITKKAFEKYAPQGSECILLMKKDSYVCSVVQDANDFVFTKKIHFYEVSPRDLYDS